MSQTKDELLRHLNMSPETYAEMARQVDHVYHWLTSDRKHLKENCKRKPPYDWSDFVEKAKDKAMEKIARSGDPHLRFYWDLAAPGDSDCPNWIARWFLYHKFRYRDGRNRNLSKADGTSSRKSRTFRGDHHDAGQDVANGYYEYAYYSTETAAYGQDDQAYAYRAAATPTNTSYTYTYETIPQYASTAQGYTQQQSDGQASGTYYDPVRDANI